MSDEPDTYDQQIQQLRIQIIDRKVLRDAQAPDSANALRFQSEIDILTSKLFAMQDRAPVLRKLDTRITNAHYEIQAADEELAGFSAGRFTGCVLLALFGLFVLVMAVDSWGFTTGLIGAALGAVGGFAAWTMVRKRGLLLDDRKQAVARRQAAEDEKEKIIKGAERPTPVVSSRPAPGQEPGVFATAISPPAES